MTSYLEAEAAVFEGTPERLSHAVTSCRRALKTLADALYPPKDSPVTGADGVERILDEEHFIARLWQFAYDQAGSSRAGELLRATIEGLGSRIDAVYGATNKGVHADVSEREADQFVTQTLMLFADLLRLRDETSAVDVEVEELPHTTAPVQPT